MDHSGEGQRNERSEVDREGGGEAEGCDEPPELSGGRGKRWRGTEGEGGRREGRVQTDTKPAPACGPGRRSPRGEEAARPGEGGRRGSARSRSSASAESAVTGRGEQPSWGRRQTLTENEGEGQTVAESDGTRGVWAELLQPMAAGCSCGLWRWDLLRGNFGGIVTVFPGLHTRLQAPQSLKFPRGASPLHLSGPSLGQDATCEGKDEGLCPTCVAGSTHHSGAGGGCSSKAA